MEGTASATRQEHHTTGWLDGCGEIEGMTAQLYFHPVHIGDFTWLEGLTYVANSMETPNYDADTTKQAMPTKPYSNLNTKGDGR